MKLTLNLLLIFWLGVSMAQTKLVNPILSGFYPDPSICRAGDDYYLVNSTFAYFPGLPIFHSRDLKNWKQIGNAVDRPSQMNFLEHGVSRGLFAPSIRFHQGVFYITCTLIDRQGNFVITATNPAGPWSDPIWISEVKGIDPCLVFEDGKVFIVYNSIPPNNISLYEGHRSVRIYELDPATLKVKGEETLLVNGGVDLSKKPVWIEGPHILKREDWYYLICAEGGTAFDHSEVVFRSKNILGPYIPYEKNPILTQKHLDPLRKHPITSAGHADIVTGPDGQDYAVFIATRPYLDDYYNTGRETFIAPVRWIDGWPVINPDFEDVQYSYPVNIKEVKLPDALPQNGNFSYRVKFEKPLHPSLLFLRTHDTSWYHLSEEQGLTMKLLPETCMGLGNPAFVAKRQQHLICTATTLLNFKTEKDNEKAGLLAFQSEYHFYYLCKSVENGKAMVQLYTGDKKNKKMNLVAEHPLTVNQDNLFLKIEAKNDRYAFYYSYTVNDWKLLKKHLDGKILSTKTAGGFVGTMFAVYATSSGAPSENTASFKWLDYVGHDIVHK